MSETKLDINEGINCTGFDIVGASITCYDTFNSGPIDRRNTDIPIGASTPLHLAVENNNLEMFDCGADDNFMNEYHWNPLLTAVSRNNGKIVDLLLERSSAPRNHNFISRLHNAVKSGSYKMKDGVHVKTICHSTDDDFTPLHIAVIQQNSLIVELLLRHGASVNLITQQGLTALHFASITGNLDIIKLLLRSNSDVNALTLNLQTPLYLAVRNSHQKAAKLLMDHMASIDAGSGNGQTVLNLAASQCSLVILEDILKHNPDRNNKSNKNSLIIAAKESDKSYSIVVENLLKYGFSVGPENINDTDLLHNAIKMGYIQIIESLIKHGLDLGCNKGENSTLLHIAAKNRQFETAKLLLANGVDVNATDRSGKAAIFYSTKNSDVNMIKLLISHGASVKKSSKLLRVATLNDCKEIVEILLQNNVDIEGTDKYGRTALHLTSDYEDTFFITAKKPDIKMKGEIAKLLLSMGANVNARTKIDGLTTLHIACERCFRNVVEVLLEYKADLDCVAEDCTPLHMAAQQGQATIIEMLLVNVNVLDVCAKNKEGDTALHLASKGVNAEIISNLLQQGCPIESRNMKSQTALHIAVGAARCDNIKLLLKFGSDINVLDCDNYTPVDTAQNFFYSTNYYEYYESHYYDLVYKILRLHLTMLKTANLYLTKRNLNFVCRLDDHGIKLHREECEDEIKNLKMEKIANSKSSFYDILTKNIHSLASYARSENLIRILESGHYKIKFPIYAPIIERNFEKCTQRRLLLEEAEEFFKFYYPLPYNCYEQILKYLSNADLGNIINA